MQKEELISVHEFCSSHSLELSFVYSLQQYGLIEITTIEEVNYIPASELPQAERIARLHSELGINLEGIDAIRHLLQRVEDMQDEIRTLRNKLRIYE
ncbi:MAG TPA: chaperone modulator CbpM [Chitinophagaceae bacterium]|nr:chaperone modulator CbpM [Chitinophagaceae bacterium]